MHNEECKKLISDSDKDYEKNVEWCNRVPGKGDII